MRSNRTRQIINEIAAEEGLKDISVWFIVMSQFEGAKKVITSGDPDDINTFKSVCINAFGRFKFLPWKYNNFIKKGMSRQVYENDKRRRYDSKK
jgi:hypothetical protein